MKVDQICRLGVLHALTWRKNTLWARPYLSVSVCRAFRNSNTRVPSLCWNAVTQQWSSITSVQQRPASCDVKNTTEMSMYSKEYFPIFFNCTITKTYTSPPNEFKNESVSAAVGGMKRGRPYITIVLLCWQIITGFLHITQAVILVEKVAHNLPDFKRHVRIFSWKKIDSCGLEVRLQHLLQIAAVSVGVRLMTAIDLTMK
jgi:hypothetical protein